MPPKLVDEAEGANILLDKPILLLGRHQECDVQLNSRKVSRRHCCIAQVNDVLLVRDLYSTNGIRINGEKVTEGKLSPGDELSVGNFQFRIDWEGHPKQNAVSKPDPKEDKSPALAILEALDDGDPDRSVEFPVALPDSKQNNKAVVPSEDESIHQAEEDKQAEIQQDAVDGENEQSVAHSSKSDSQMEDQPPSIVLPDNLELESSDEFKSAK